MTSKSAVRDRRDGSPAVLDHVGREAHPLEQPEGELLVHGVVLGEQDPQARRCGLDGRPAARRRSGRGSCVCPRTACSARRRASASARASCSADGFTGLTSIARDIRGAAAVLADRREDDHRHRRVGRRSGEVARPAPRRPVRASASRGRRASNCCPPRTHCSASSGDSVASPTRRPSESRKLVRIRRFVALSSTTRIRQPRRLRSGAGGGASGQLRRGRRAARGGTCCLRRRRPVLVAVRLPPIDSASRRLIARPRPVPP